MHAQENKVTAPLAEAEVARYHQTGVVRVAEAFPRDTALELQEILWRDAERRLGVGKTDPGTWSAGNYWTRFKSVRSLTARVKGPRLTAALDQLLGPNQWQYPKKWGGLLISPPDPPPARWTLTDRFWHWDPPLEGAVIFGLLSDIAPRCGGTLLLEGSSRVLHDWLSQRPSDHVRKPRRLRNEFLASHPFLRRLSGRDRVDNDPEDLLAPHVDEQGRRLRVAEVSGHAGDVFVIHSSLLHARAVHTGSTPRFLGIEHIATTN